MIDQIDSLSKDGLLDFAAVRGIEVDGRWGTARLRDAIRDALQADGAPAGLVSEIVMTDMVAMGDDDVSLPASATWPESVGENIQAPTTYSGGSVAPVVRPAQPDGLNIDAIVWEWAESFCAGLDLAFADFDGDMMTVTIRTRHGETVETVEGVAMNADAIRDALAVVRAKIEN